ncbi:mycobactin biosynthesis enzyme MbtG domain protein [Mycobacterium xenopi 4042]|uniref:Mycobactin biosynthesis enzyme MbtG domain protein n=1 Tax=Mycobacterium xenopi 4042 TaxID=1299334 RepID=X8ARE7_MYCXE|nr:mycobactin biosynthesis enzyme MbtG domain protein [Mycobacterium xenopi 4042]
MLGAGAKAVAVAAKASVLRDMGVGTPDVVAVERIEVAANWQASGGGPTAPTAGHQPGKRCRLSLPILAGAAPQRRTRRADDPLQLAVLPDHHRSVRRLDRPRPTRTHAPAVGPVLALGGRASRYDSGGGEVERLSVDGTAGRCTRTKPLYGQML